MSGVTAPLRPRSDSQLTFSSQAGFGLSSLSSATGVSVAVLPTGAVYALRHQSTLINQVLPGPAEDGLFRLLLRERPASEAVAGATSLVGAGLPFQAATAAATWRQSAGTAGRLACTTTLILHPRLPAWAWRIRVRNEADAPRAFDLVLAQDLGLGDEAAVRNNEAYTSQYLDLLPVRDDALGWTILARQNQAAAGGRHPWLAHGCAQGATDFCTDGTQFFGPDHRLTGEPAAARLPRLPSKRLQYEFALAGLQSRILTAQPGETVEVTFLARFLEDHPAASAPDETGLLRAVAGDFALVPDVPPAPASAPGAPLFVSAPWLHGDEPSARDLAAWFPEPHRHRERAADGRVLAFFCGASTHVVTRAKEATIARPHGHVLRSGPFSWIDDEQFGLTAYAAGIFSAQTYVGNASLARLLSVVRNALNVARGSGQRAFVRRDGRWCQLGVPSVFAVTPGEVRWIYRLGATTLLVRAWCSANLPAAFVAFEVVAGPAVELLVVHQLALGSNEFESGGRAAAHGSEAWLECTLDPASFTATRLPRTVFALALADPGTAARFRGDEALHADGVHRQGPYVVVEARATQRLGLIQLGTHEGAEALSSLVGAARAEYASASGPSAPPAFPLRLEGRDAGVARTNDILPWFNHNAAIHFSAPHGLEQYGGAAWGVRDVCQGSLEWLLAGGQATVAARMLQAVFARQYFAPHDATLMGTWPQWFMFPPFHQIQQAHSHGDVCFWPVKALCDYIEAANDFGILSWHAPYTDPRTFSPAGPEETLWEHCDRVIANVESRFIPGTALVNYGDGDWDDTLQPADASMRTRLVSAWTVGLACHTFRQFAEICRRAGDHARARRLTLLLDRMRADFARHLMPDGIVAGFLATGEKDGPRPLLHPRDRVTGIRYRLLPMTRSILAELFAPDEARRHLELIERELRYPDGVRLMSEPATYRGGVERLFRRAETAANVGREIGLQYVHAHLRYAEALAKVGDADRLWTALQVVNPVGLEAILPNAAPRQSNVYFSSSDADFADRYEAAARWEELRTGRVAVRAGWRLYSSGPGLFLHKVRACLLGLRESFGDVVFDPVLPLALDGLVARTTLAGVPVEVTYRVSRAGAGPARVLLNGQPLPAAREPNPYRLGGLRVAGEALTAPPARTGNRLVVEL